jgi:hypothetical protein
MPSFFFRQQVSPILFSSYFQYRQQNNESCEFNDRFLLPSSPNRVCYLGILSSMASSGWFGFAGWHDEITGAAVLFLLNRPPPQVHVRATLHDWAVHL